MTAHADLVKRAVRWLRRECGCSRIFAEFAGATAEIPDAIGWRFGNSHLVEVKTSRADYRADLAKPRHARPDAGMGLRRWFFMPEGLVRPDEVPAGWGLVELAGRSARITVEATPRTEYDARSEVVILLSALRRHEIGVPWDPLEGRFCALTDPRHPENRRHVPPAESTERP